jgi:hypothetical protein
MISLRGSVRPDRGNAFWIRDDSLEGNHEFGQFRHGEPSQLKERQVQCRVILYVRHLPDRVQLGLCLITFSLCQQATPFTEMLLGSRQVRLGFFQGGFGH